MQIRNVMERDYRFVLALNEKNVEVLAPMDLEKLRFFVDNAEVFWVVEEQGKPIAFLIALREGNAAYDSENYRWFGRHYKQFLYVDRIVIDESDRGKGIGRQLYDKIFEHARSAGVPFVTAEIDTVPYNGPSLKFHEAMGFKEVGTQSVRGGKVTVSLVEARV